MDHEYGIMHTLHFKYLLNENNSFKIYDKLEY